MESKESAFEVVWPLGKTINEMLKVPDPVSDLSEKTICELSDYLFKAEEIFPQIRDVLKKRYPDIKFIDHTIFGNTHGKDESEVIKSLPEKLRAHGCDAVISGVGG